jgi:hypothetical protein
MPVQVDFTPVLSREATLAELTSGLTVDDFRRLSHQAIDRMLDALDGVNDEDLAFVATDPDAADGTGWTIGHVIVHATATLEEAAMLSSELARGVEREGRSRYETPWEMVTTVAQLCQRLAESRRMLLAALDLWPDEPHLETEIFFAPFNTSLNCKERLGLSFAHDSMHHGHIAEIRRQLAERTIEA